jgi:Zn-dependent protease
MLLLFQIVVLLFAFSVHESVHAWAALKLGDATGMMLGRITLNPAQHIDPWGSIVMPALSYFLGGGLVGWAKPCPVTLRNFRRLKRDDILSTCAGLGSFLVVALIALILLILLKHSQSVGADAVFSAMQLANHIPTDMTELPRLFPIALLLYYGVVMNITLFVFNLIPVPPLDGSRLIRYVLPYAWEQAYDRMGMLGWFVIFFVAERILFPILNLPLLGTFNALLVRL